MKYDLATKHCQSCEGHIAPLNSEEVQHMQSKLGGGWTVAGDHLERKYEFPDFREALDFTNRVGEVAEAENHHPDIFLTYGEVRLQLSTHSAGGLTENDFILAAKISELD